MALFMTYREMQLNDATAKRLEIQQLHILVLVVAFIISGMSPSDAATSLRSPAQSPQESPPEAYGARAR
jgi:hypothetical protein